MSALPPKQMRAMRPPSESSLPIEALSIRWELLHEKAAQVAKLAQIAPEKASHPGVELASLLSAASAWQCEIAGRGIEDADAMMHHGIAALQCVAERGQDPSVPALALWREFYHAREAVLCVAAPLKDAQPAG